MPALRPATPGDLLQVRELFREYAAGVGDAICFQAFERELAELPGRYAPPSGCLIVALDAGRFVGCAALRQLEPGVGEMKRLYVRPGLRTAGLGRRLAQRIIEEAKAAGHCVLRLDTLPTMQAAIALYRSLGFREIPGYADNPPSAICFELHL